MFEKLKKMGLGYPALGAVALIIGICFLFFQSSLAALTVIVGMFFAFLGVGIACLCILRKKSSFEFVVKIVIASLIFIAGILVKVFNDASFGVLTSVLCLLLIVSGVFKLDISIKSKLLSIDGWWIITVVSAAVTISAFLLAKIAPESASGSSIWLGITALADAAGNFLSMFWSKKCKTAEKASIYYEVYKDIESSK